MSCSACFDAAAMATPRERDGSLTWDVLVCPDGLLRYVFARDLEEAALLLEQPDQYGPQEPMPEPAY